MYDTIRPLYDSELHEALLQIAASPLFAPIARYIYPNEEPSAAARRITRIGDIHTLQDTVMRDAIEQILQRSVTHFSHEGREKLEQGKPYLFISNHRDITLDAFLLQYLLFDYNQLFITFGANLMQDPVVTLIGRANRMFRVERGGTPKTFYRNMLQVSSYIRHTLVQERHSVWIAQRNGRTKDGIDRTEVSLLKMLAMSGQQRGRSVLDPLKTLHIVPISVSYEWEPCDLLKAHELHLRAIGPYRKGANEDLNSVLTGILQPKGDVHITIADPVSDDEIDRCATTDTPFDNMAALIDRRILNGYRLHDTNYIAHSMLYTHACTPRPVAATLRSQFVEHLQQADEAEQKILTNLYANPVVWHQQMKTMHDR